MIVDFKYHIASLVAVFMALGIGVIIGSSVLGESLVQNIVAEQELLISRLEEDYDGLKAELAITREEIKKQKAIISDYQRYAEDTFAHILKDRLKGKKIALVVNPLSTDAGALIRNGLELAGAELLLDMSLEEVCAMVDSFSVDSVVVWGEGKEKQELIARLKDSKVPIYAGLSAQQNNGEEIPGLVSLILQMAQGK
jgi:hypothetical protein